MTDEEETTIEERVKFLEKQNDEIRKVIKKIIRTLKPKTDADIVYELSGHK
jgi:flagellar motility protein MotE (MotC chaperone)